MQGIKDLLQGFAELFKQRTMLVFMASAVIFHFANATMVPLVAQTLAKNVGARTAILYTSGYMVASQLIVLVVAAVSGQLASSLGRKPLFLFAFAALAVRGVLYTLSDKPAALIAVQCIDRLGAGIFGVVSVLIVADLTKGTGRFNAAQGVIATAQGCGAFLSNYIGGLVAKHMGNDFTFYMLAAIATGGLVFFWLLMPETRDKASEDCEVKTAVAMLPPRSLHKPLLSMDTFEYHPIPARPSETLSRLHFGDLHLTGEREQNYQDLLALVAQANAHLSGPSGVDFAFLPGDNADNGIEAQYRLLRRALEGLCLPVHALPGDHDIQSGNLHHFRRWLEPVLPRSVVSGAYRCVFLNSVDIEGKEGFDMGRHQIAYLDGELCAAKKAGQKTMLFMHTFPSELGHAGADIRPYRM